METINPTITPMVLVRSDAHCDISEATITYPGGRIERTSLIVTKPGADPVGNRHHGRPVTFILVEGEAVLLTQDVITIIVRRSRLTAGTVVEIPAGLAYAIVPKGQITLICRTDRAEADMKTSPWDFA